MTTDPALGYVNLVRYLVGLSHNVVTTEESNELAQAATVVNAANDVLSHYPTRPAGMSDELLPPGRRGSEELEFGRRQLPRGIVGRLGLAR